MIEELVSRVFFTRNAAHLSHWATQSYSQHMALGSFYDDVLDKLDDIVETYQGSKELIGGVQVITKPVPKNMVNHLDLEVEWIRKNRETIADGCTAIENLIDGLLETYLRTIYKLDNLK